MTATFRDLGNITDSGNDKKWDYHEQMAKYQMDDSEFSQKKGNDKTADECDG